MCVLTNNSLHKDNLWSIRELFWRPAQRTLCILIVASSSFLLTMQTGEFFLKNVALVWIWVWRPCIKWMWKITMVGFACLYNVCRFSASVLGSISPTFYAQHLCSQMPKAQKKTVKSSSFFALLRPACVKAGGKHIDEIDSWRVQQSLNVNALW